jgi:hypothetical protein
LIGLDDQELLILMNEQETLIEQAFASPVVPLAR